MTEKGNGLIVLLNQIPIIDTVNDSRPTYLPETQTMLRKDLKEFLEREYPNIKVAKNSLNIPSRVYLSKKTCGAIWTSLHSLDELKTVTEAINKNLRCNGSLIYAKIERAKKNVPDNRSDSGSNSLFDVSTDSSAHAESTDKQVYDQPHTVAEAVAQISSHDLLAKLIYHTKMANTIKARLEYKLIKKIKENERVKQENIVKNEQLKNLEAEIEKKQSMLNQDLLENKEKEKSLISLEEELKDYENRLKRKEERLHSALEHFHGLIKAMIELNVLSPTTKT
jgi:hypothetical protein